MPAGYKLSDEDKQAIVDAVSADDATTYGMIAKQFAVSRGRVSQLALAAGITRSSGPKPKWRQYPYELREMYHALARKFGNNEARQLVDEHVRSGEKVEIGG
jgi:hypothetical protein